MHNIFLIMIFKKIPENCIHIYFGMGCFGVQRKVFWDVPGLFTTLLVTQVVINKTPLMKMFVLDKLVMLKL